MIRIDELYLIVKDQNGFILDADFIYWMPWAILVTLLASIIVIDLVNYGSFVVLEKIFKSRSSQYSRNHDAACQVNQSHE